MSEKVYINDDYGTKIPLLDDYGNLSMQVIMLYTEDKLTAADRKLVDDFCATDEMSKDALEGFALTSNASKTRHLVNELNAEIQKKTGAKPVSVLAAYSKPAFNYQRMAAAIGLLIVVGGTSVLISRMWTKDELADTMSADKKEVYQPTEAKVYEKSLGETGMIDSVSALNDATLEGSFSESSNSNGTENGVAAQKTASENAVSQALVKDDKTTPVVPSTKVAGINAPVEEPTNMEAKAAQQTSEYKAEELAVADDQVAVVEESAEMDSGAMSTVAANAEPATTQENSGAQLAQEEAERIVEAQSRKRENSRAEVLELMEAEQPASLQSAQFPGGDLKLYQFLNQNKQYSQALEAQGISGNVTISFEIDVNGNVRNAKIKNGVNGILDQDALRVVRSMPKWTPANLNGEPTNSSRSVVIKYGD